MNTLIRINLTEKLGKKIDRKNINLCDKIICQHKYELDLNQQDYLNDNKNCKESNILSLAQEVYKNSKLIEQTEEFKNVRKFLQKLWRGGEYDNYTDEQLDFLFENAEHLTPKEIAKTLFPDKEYIVSLRTITSLLDAAGFREVKDDEKIERTNARYNSPRTDLQVMNLINRSDHAAKYDSDKMDMRKKDSIAAVKKFLSAPRFVEMISMITNVKHREVFETEFVKAVYNKPDLNSDEVNLYIGLALEYVTLIEIRQQITILNDRLTESMSDDEEGRKFTMSLSEALKDKTAAYNHCLERTLKMTRSLSGDRIKKLEKQALANQSLAQFIELVQDEKERRRMILIAKAEEFKVKEKIQELENFSELFVEVYGVGKEEVFSL